MCRGGGVRGAILSTSSQPTLSPVSLAIFSAVPIEQQQKKRFPLRADRVSHTPVASSVLQPFKQERKTKGHFKTTSKRSIGQASVISALCLPEATQPLDLFVFKLS